MKKILLLLLLSYALVAHSQDYTSQVVEFYKQGVSLQQACTSCPKDYRLYDAITKGLGIEREDWRVVAAICGEVVGIEYNRSAADNIRILHAVMTEGQVKELATRLRGEVSHYSSSATATVDNEVMMREVADTAVIETSPPSYEPIDIEHMEVEMIQAKPEKVRKVIEPIAAFGSWLDDKWTAWVEGRDASAYRAARYAIRMACKYGGYEGPVGYFSSRRGQERFVEDNGLSVPFLGYEEGAYRRWYGSKVKVREKPKIGHTHHAIPLSLIGGKTRRVSVAQSRRACRKQGKL